MFRASLRKGQEGNFLPVSIFSPCSAEPGYTFAFANSVDSDQLVSEEAN